METSRPNITPKKKNRKKFAIIFTIVVVSTLLWAGLTVVGYIPNFLEIEILFPEEEAIPFTPAVVIKKPVIYLYPEQKQNVQVQLNYIGEVIADYPEYDEKLKGWSIIAYPDGRITNLEGTQEYSYLFWEGMPKERIDWDLSKGFIVRGEDTKEFLWKTLSKIGLTPKEFNEFIVYWYPLMQDNKYNLIHFADEQYTGNAVLTINPKPDSILRVFMVYKPLDKPIEIAEQEIRPFERKGFTVIEWGGTKAE